MGVKKLLRAGISVLLVLAMLMSTTVVFSAFAAPAAVSSDSAANGDDSANSYELDLPVDNEIVRVIVELDGNGVLADDENEIIGVGELNDPAQKAEKAMLSAQARIQDKIAEILGVDKLEVVYDFTLTYNGFTIDVPEDKIDAISSIDGVRSVYTDPIVELVSTDADDSANTRGVTEVQSGQYTGKGTVIAVIDTGIDLTHDAFKNAPAEAKLSFSDIEAVYQTLNAYLERGSLSYAASDYYHSAKIPFIFNYADDSFDVSHNNDEETDHGTHVAGIAAGYAVDSEGAVVFTGVAPDAQIVVMKVFGNKRAGQFSDIMAAVEDALLLNVDVVNLSLGSCGGFSYAADRPALYTAYENLANAGVTVAAAAGNEYTSAYGNLYGNDKSLASNPDNGIVGSPASYTPNLAVASVSGAIYKSVPIKVGTRSIGYTNNYTDESRNILKSSLAGKIVEFAVLRDNTGKVLTGSAEEFANYAESCGVEGKFVVVKRGRTFTETVQIAEDNGAIGLVVFNHSEGSLVSMAENEDVSIPAIFISKDDGQYIVDYEATSNKMTISTEITEIANPGAGAMSEFSSLGVNPDLTLKPEITAPGGTIYSATNNNTYGIKSGTSMATPYMAGVAAAVRQYLREAQNGLWTSVEGTKAEKDLVSALAMSTAEPLTDPNTNALYTPRKQGAGQVNLENIFNTKAYITVAGAETPKMDLGDDKTKTGVYDMTFTVNNFSNTALTYTADVTVLTEQVVEETVEYRTCVPQLGVAQKYRVDEITEKFMSGLAKDITANSTVEYISGADANGVVTVAANSTTTVTVRVTLDAETKAYMDENFENGIYVDGFVRLLSESEVDLCVPFLAFYGDWTQAPIIDNGTWMDRLAGVETYPQMDVSTANYSYWLKNGLFGGGDFLYALGTNQTYMNGYDFAKAGSTYNPDTMNVISSWNIRKDNVDEVVWYDQISDVETSLLRGAAAIEYKVVDAETGEVYKTQTIEAVGKSYQYSASYGIIHRGYFTDYRFVWRGTDAEGNYLPSGTKAIVTVTALLDYEDGGRNTNARNSYSFPVTIDGICPVPGNIDLQYDENDDLHLLVEVVDDQLVQRAEYKIYCTNIYGADFTLYITHYPTEDEIQSTMNFDFNITEWCRNTNDPNKQFKGLRAIYVEVVDWIENGATMGDSYVDYGRGSGPYGEYTLWFDGSMSLVQPSQAIIAGEQIQLQSVTAPADNGFQYDGDDNETYGVEDKIIYTSSDESVATVDEDGFVTGVAAGNATITGRTKFSNLVSSVTVTVVDSNVIQEIVDGNYGMTAQYNDGDIAQNVIISDDIVLDLGGAEITNASTAYPVFEITAGNVTIKNATITAKSGNLNADDYINLITGGAAPAIKVSGGTLTLEEVTVNGAVVNVTNGTYDLNGEVTVGDAVQLMNGAALNVTRSELRGLYAIDNAVEGQTAGGLITINDGSFIGIISAIKNPVYGTGSDNVAFAAGAEAYDLRELAANGVTDGTVDLSMADKFASTAKISVAPGASQYYSAQWIYENATILGSGMTMAYDADTDEIVLTLAAGSAKTNQTPPQGLLKWSVDLNPTSDNIVAVPYRNMVMPGTWNYMRMYFTNQTKGASTYSYVAHTIDYKPNRGSDVASVQVFDLGALSSYDSVQWNGQHITSMGLWPFSWSSAPSAENSVRIGGVAIYDDITDLAEAVTTNLTGGSKSLSTTALLVVDTTGVAYGVETYETAENVQLTVVPESTIETVANTDARYGYTWKADTIHLFNANNEEIASSSEKVINADGNAVFTFPADTEFAGTTVEFSVALNLSDEQIAAIADGGIEDAAETYAKFIASLGEIIAENLKFDSFKANMTQLIKGLDTVRDAYVYRDTLGVDCPLGPNYVAAAYGNDSTIVGKNAANNFGKTWTEYFDNYLYPRLVGGYTTKISNGTYTGSGEARVYTFEYVTPSLYGGWYSSYGNYNGSRVSSFYYPYRSLYYYAAEIFGDDFSEDLFNQGYLNEMYVSGAAKKVGSYYFLSDGAYYSDTYVPFEFDGFVPTIEGKFAEISAAYTDGIAAGKSYSEILAEEISVLADNISEISANIGGFRDAMKYDTTLNGNYSGYKYFLIDYMLYSSGLGVTTITGNASYAGSPFTEATKITEAQSGMAVWYQGYYANATKLRKLTDTSSVLYSLNQLVDSDVSDAVVDGVFSNIGSIVEDGKLVLPTALEVDGNGFSSVSRITYVDSLGAFNPNKTSYKIVEGLDSLAALTFDEYVFEGWFDGDDNEITSIAPNSGDITLYAKWTDLRPLQHAVNAAEAGDTINWTNDVDEVTVTVDKALTINFYDATVAAPAEGAAIVITADGVELNGGEIASVSVNVPVAAVEEGEEAPAPAVTVFTECDIANLEAANNTVVLTNTDVDAFTVNGSSVTAENSAFGKINATDATLAFTGSAVEEIKASDVTATFDGGNVNEADFTNATVTINDASMTDVEMYFTNSRINVNNSSIRGNAPISLKDAASRANVVSSYIKSGSYGVNNKYGAIVTLDDSFVYGLIGAVCDRDALRVASDNTVSSAKNISEYVAEGTYTESELEIANTLVTDGVIIATKLPRQDVANISADSETGRVTVTAQAIAPYVASAADYEYVPVTATIEALGETVDFELVGDDYIAAFNGIKISADDVDVTVAYELAYTVTGEQGEILLNIPKTFAQNVLDAYGKAVENVDNALGKIDEAKAKMRDLYKYLNKAIDLLEDYGGLLLGGIEAQAQLENIRDSAAALGGRYATDKPGDPEGYVTELGNILGTVDLTDLDSLLAWVNVNYDALKTLSDNTLAAMRNIVTELHTAPLSDFMAEGSLYDNDDQKDKVDGYMEKLDEYIEKVEKVATLFEQNFTDEMLDLATTYSSELDGLAAKTKVIVADNTVMRFDVAYTEAAIIDLDAMEVALTVTATNGTVTANGADWYDDHTENVKFATAVTLAATANDGASFLYWKDLNDRVLSEETTYTVYPTTDTTIIAVFAEEEQYFVTAFDGANRIVETNSVSSEEAASEWLATIDPADLNFTNEMTFNGEWRITVDGHNVLAYAEYTIAPTKYHITVTGGTIGGQSEYYVQYNVSVTVTYLASETPAGKVFAGWSTDGGATIVSYDKVYRFFVVGDTDVVAVYADSVVVKPTVTIKSTPEAAGKVAFVVERSVPSGYTFVSSGILFSKTNSTYTDETMRLYNVDANADLIKGTTKDTNANGQYKAIITNASTVYARGFLVYVDNATGETVELYTDIISATAN